jgi:hypothetical protein
MILFKRAIPVVVVWSVALACFAGLIHVLRAPIIPPDSPNDAPIDAAGMTVRPLTNVIELAPILIVGRRPRSAAPESAVPMEETRELVCGEWRPLEQGDISQRVRSCE